MFRRAAHGLGIAIDNAARAIYRRVLGLRIPAARIRLSDIELDRDFCAQRLADAHADSRYWRDQLTAKNGARAKILLTLAREGMLPVAEIAEFTRMTDKQVRDNSTMARAEGLISSERDEVTRQLAFKITPAGRKWVAGFLIRQGGLDDQSPEPR